MDQVQLLVVDLGSQYTLVIGRTLREIGYRSIVLSPMKAEQWLKRNKPKGIILSGGSASVYDQNAPQPPRQVLKAGVPILGICYGMQWLAKKFGGKVEPHPESREYGLARVTLNTKNQLFLRCIDDATDVWASHGDSVRVLPKGFVWIGLSHPNRSYAAMESPGRKIWGVQFHPEVTQTQEGKRILENFAGIICQCEVDWEPSDVVKEMQKEVLQAVGDAKVLIGFSGGVDSTTLSAILAPVLGKRFRAVTIDTGALREGELQEIVAAAKAAKVHLKVVRAAARFQKAIGHTADAETKRQRFKKLYGSILDEEARQFGAAFIAQGSLATDIIESGGVGQAALIKSHHNVGLNLVCQELHPFRNLFKYEVRELAAAVGLPQVTVNRQPFPGPGLFLRVVGKAPRPERLAIVRWADAQVRTILQRHNLWGEISQCIVALICVPTVGIKGDGRVYKPMIVVRTVKTSDFMTVNGFQLPADVRSEITSTVTRHSEIVRVVYDETNKPPATTEME